MKKKTKRKTKVRRKVTKKVKKVQPLERKWTSGVNAKSSMSYEKYLKSGLEIISKNFSVRTYKLAPKDQYPHFERGKDLRVQLYWKNKYIEGSEFLVEQSFWYVSNKNKEDRAYMRGWADIKLKQCYDACQRGKTAFLKKSKRKKRAKKK
tara:strand:- start:2080 stop:2529 length:450 start_codon:yes stop_codon:yes gene_type:complete